MDPTNSPERTKRAAQFIRDFLEYCASEAQIYHTTRADVATGLAPLISVMLPEIAREWAGGNSIDKVVAQFVEVWDEA